jgi:hypothetical protein
VHVAKDTLAADAAFALQEALAGKDAEMVALKRELVAREGAFATVQVKLLQLQVCLLVVWEAQSLRFLSRNHRRKCVDRAGAV